MASNYLTDLPKQLLSLGCGLGLSLAGCSIPQSISGQSPAPTASPAATAKPSPVASPQPTASPKTATKPAVKAPLTFEKLKNTQYYILASGPVKLKDGKAEDQDKRVFTLNEPFAYGDLNKDGVKDAASPLTITIDDRNFVYLVTVINDQGKPRNNTAQFLEEGVTVTELSIDGNNILVKMERPDVTITRTYEVKNLKATQDNQSPVKDGKPRSQNPVAPAPTASPTKSP
jgi:hypothetical protein